MQNKLDLNTEDTRKPYTPALKSPNLKELLDFQRLLHSQPENIKINKMANNAKYLPIGEVEKTLDELYSGLWQTTDFHFQVIANEIVGSIYLQVFHPVARVWITRTGAASTMILTIKDKPANVDNKIKNTLVKDFPHLKAECIKNAARSLGVKFGRDLNRQEVSDFTDITEHAKDQEYRNDLLRQINELLDNSEMPENQKTAKQNSAKKATISQLEKFIKNFKS
jgi:hypothetical protein